MHIHISPKNGVPLYLQIVNQVKYLVASGVLKSGDEILPIRGLAEKLLINPNTVARAYRELETAGILVKRLGAGTYVSAEGSPLAWSERLKILGERATGLLTEAHQLGVPVEQLIELIQKRSQELAWNETEGSKHE
ncbi:MAG: GntR family transcriptional regulator [Candidatus Hydrogenedentes bacterium]|nr:GntR family transcriptional regulator [Candidatus Hydrogenedentota bacterium]